MRKGGGDGTSGRTTPSRARTQLHGWVEGGGGGGRVAGARGGEKGSPCNSYIPNLRSKDSEKSTSSCGLSSTAMWVYHWTIVSGTRDERLVFSTSIKCRSHQDSYNFGTVDVVIVQND